MQQLSLFDSEIYKTANHLLELLNDGIKKGEAFEPQYTFIQDDYTVLIAANKHKEVLFNVLDLMGNIPNGFSANWRTIHHIKQELKF